MASDGAHRAEIARVNYLSGNGAVRRIGRACAPVVAAAIRSTQHVVVCRWLGHVCLEPMIE